MKKLILAISLLTIVFSGPVFAQDLFWQNNIGIYTDGGDFDIDANVFESFIVHVMLTNATSPDITGFEFKLVQEGALLLGDRIIDYPHVNAATREGEFVVGFAGPHPISDGTFELMHFEIVVTDDIEAAYLYIRKIYFDSYNDVPCYVNDADEFVQMHQSTGDGTDPVLLINRSGGGQVVPTKSTNFDGLKSLYR